MDSRLAYVKAASRTDDFCRDAARQVQARDARPPRDTSRSRPRPIAHLAGALHLRRGMLRAHRGA